MEERELSKFYDNKKKFLRLPIVVVILLVFILSATHVFSSGKLEALIEFNGNKWSLNESFSADKEWLINDEDRVEFIVDLSHYYNSLDEIDELIEPFNLSASYQEEPIEADSIEEVKSEDDEFNGKYRVVYSLDELVGDGTLELKLKFEEENEWKIPIEQDGLFEFAIIKDTEAPEITISGVEDEGVFYRDWLNQPVYPELRIEITDPLLSKEDRVEVSLNDEPIVMDWQEETALFSGSYQTEADGVYRLDVKASDRAGNQSSERLVFYVNNDGPDFELISDGESIENKDYLTNGKLKFLINNNALIEKIKLLITKDGEEYDEIDEFEIDGTSASLSHEFEEGTYQIAAHIKDAGEEGVNHEIDPIEFTVDLNKPVIDLVDSDGESFDELNDKSQGKAKLIIADENLDVDSIKFSIKREDTTSKKDVDYTKDSSDGRLTIDFDMDQEGIYYVEATATDLAGHKQSLNQSIVVDLESPIITIVDADQNELKDVYRDPVELTFTLSDLTLSEENTTFEVQKYSAKTREFESYLTEKKLITDDFFAALTYKFDEGRYRIDISTTDEVGRVKTVQQSFLVDLNDPEIKFESPIESGQHINQKVIEELDTEGLFSITIKEEFLQSKKVTVTRPDANDHEVELSEDELGEWHQNEEQPKQYSFIFNEDIWQQEGRYDIEIEAIDQAGRKSEEAFSFILDDTAPKIEVTELAEYHNQNVDVEVKVTEANFEQNNVTVTIERQSTEGKFEEYDGSFSEWENQAVESSETYLFTKDGTYRIEIAAVDKAGNKAESVEREFTIHRDEPELSIEGVEDDQHYNQDLEVELSITSAFLDTINSSIMIEKWDQKDEEFKFYSDESKESSISLSLKETLSEPGNYRIRLTGQDLAGNISEPKEVQFVIDKQKPIVSIEGIENDAIYGENQTIELAVNEKYYETNNVKLTVRRDDKDITDEVEKLIGRDWSIQESESKATYETRHEGNYTIRLEATDKAGNQADVVEKSFVIDSSVPTIMVKGIKNQVDYAEDRMLEVEIRDRNFKQNSIEVLKDGEVYDVGDFEITRRIFQDSIARLNHTFTEEGMYEVLIKSIDRSNNQSEKKLSFIIDKTAPVIELGKDIPNFITSGAIKKQGIDQLIPIDIFEERINKKEIKITRTSPSGNMTIFKEADFGVWKQESDSHYRFKFNNDFFTTDGDYEIIVEVSDLAGQSVRDLLAFTIDDQKPVINLSRISRYNNEPVTQNIEIIENNYQNNKVTIDVYRENNQGRFVDYNHQNVSNWRNTGRTSRLSLDFGRDGTYRVEVNAVDAAGNRATTASQTFTVDQINPSLTIQGVSNQLHYNRNRRVTVEVKDTNIHPNRTNLMIDKLNHTTGKMERYHAVPNLTFDDTSAKWNHVFSTDDEGVFQIRLNATDRAGNRNVHDMTTFTIDNTAPLLQANQINDGEYYRSNRTAEFVVRERHFAENKVNFEVTRDGQNITSLVEGEVGSAWRNTSERSRLSYHFNQDGTYSISMQAKDLAGNVAQPVNKNFVIDTVNPAIEIQGVENSEYYNVDRSMSVTIRDVNLDQQTIRVTRDGVNYPVGNFSITNHRYQDSIASLNHTFTSEGEYEVFVEAIDQAGNRDQTQLSFTIDKTAPEITPRMGVGGTVIEDGAYINQVFTPVFELDNPDEDMIDSVTLNGGTNLAGRVPIAGQEMTYQYRVIASDRAGNSTELNISFVVDTTMPALTISGIVDGYFNESLVPIVEYADDNLDEERTSVTLNGSPFTSGTAIQEEKAYILNATIVDLANNITEQSIVFTIDKTAPTIHFNEPMSNQYFNNVLIPEFFIKDMTDYEIIAMTLNGEPYELGQKIETEGKHVLYFEVMDRAGNIKKLTVEFIIDMTAPEFIVEGVEHNQRYYESVDISLSLINQEDVIQTITVNDQDYQGHVIEGENGQSIQMSFSEQDTYQIKTIAYDLAGNQTSYDLQFEIAEKTILMKWYENRPLFLGSVASFVVASGAGSTVFIRKRKQLKISKSTE